MTKPPEEWHEQRRETRRLVTGVARMAQRMHIILGEEQIAHPCRLLDVSKSGYRIGLKPMPHIENGSEIILELTDGTRQRVSVCWVSDYEVGLNVIPPDQPRR